MSRAIVALVTFCIALAFSTQLLAGYVQYDPLIGKPIFSIGDTKYYWFFDFLVWIMLFGKYVPTLVLKSSVPLLLWLVAMMGISFMNMKKPQKDYHGNASYAELSDIKKMGFFPKSGVICGIQETGLLKKDALINSLGTIISPQKINWWLMKTGKKLGLYKYKYIRHDDKHHMIVLAPTRSGKGVGLIVPTLLGEWKGSCIVTDIKGENWGITAGYRQKVMGQKVIKFEPTASDGSSARFNPFNEVRFGTQYEISDIQNVAGIIVDPEGKGDLDHWKLSARNLLVGLICHMHYAHIKEPDKNPALTLNQLASTLKNSLVPDPDNEGAYKAIGFFESVEKLTQYQHWPENGMPMEVVDADRNSPTYGQRKMITVTTEHMKTIYPEATNLTVPGLNMTHPIAFESFIDIASKAENERASVVSTANALLTLYSDPVLATNTRESDFTLYDIMNYEQPVTLYLITPPSDIKRIQPLFRLLVEMIVRHNTRDMKFEDGKQVDTFKHRCLLLLDEFPALGRMDTFEEQLAYIAGYGLKAFMICQGLPQLQKIYTKENSIVTNCHIQIFYAPNDTVTADEIEKQLGKYTEEVETWSKQPGFLQGKSHSNSYIAKSLMTADESKRMGDKELIFMTGEKPILTEKVKYYMDEYFSSKVMNAPAKSDIIPKNTDKPSSDTKEGGGDDPKQAEASKPEEPNDEGLIKPTFTSIN